MHKRVEPMSVREAVVGRRSLRQFLPDPVPREIVEQILNDAARAPSGTNSQPWLTYVVTGATRERLSKAVIAAAKAGERQEEYAYFPDDIGEPYLSRRRKVGFDLYGLYGIDRKDMAGRQRASLRNFEYFDAPVGVFFTMDRRLQYGSWLDVGMFMQNFMVLARGHGLETCPQQAWCHYGPVVHRELAIPDSEVIVSGLSLGYEDTSAKCNTLVTERVPAAEFAKFLD
jgi:nitroreductase